MSDSLEAAYHILLGMGFTAFGGIAAALWHGLRMSSNDSNKKPLIISRRETRCREDRCRPPTPRVTVEEVFSICSTPVRPRASRREECRGEKVEQASILQLISTEVECSELFRIVQRMFQHLINDVVKCILALQKITLHPLEDGRASVTPELTAEYLNSLARRDQIDETPPDFDEPVRRHDGNRNLYLKRPLSVGSSSGENTIPYFGMSKRQRSRRFVQTPVPAPPVFDSEGWL